MPRQSNRIHRHLDPLVLEAARALAERRDAVLPNEHALAVASRIGRSDVNSAIRLFREASAGSGYESLLDGPAREDEGV